MEKKQLLRRNIGVIAALTLLIGAVLLAGRLLPARLTPTGGVLATDAPAASSDPALPPSTDAPAEEVRAYLVVSVGENTYEPIPLRAPGRFTVTRGENVNVIEVTEDSVRMAESTCDNQDCVYQGIVSLDNMNDRLLQNMVICLPNEVTLHLYTPELLREAVTILPEESHAP